jgi:hypothetical protein
MKGHIEEKLEGHQCWEWMVKGHKMKGHIEKKSGRATNVENERSKAINWKAMLRKKVEGPPMLRMNGQMKQIEQIERPCWEKKVGRATNLENLNVFKSIRYNWMFGLLKEFIDKKNLILNKHVI